MFLLAFQPQTLLPLKYPEQQKIVISKCTTSSFTSLSAALFGMPSLNLPGNSLSPYKIQFNITSSFWKLFLTISGVIRYPMSTHLLPPTYSNKTFINNFYNYKSTYLNMPTGPKLCPSVFQPCTIIQYLEQYKYTQEVSVKTYWVYFISSRPLKLSSHLYNKPWFIFALFLFIQCL